MFVYVLLLVFAYITLSTTRKEGYESYDNCLEQGYPHAFCLRVPLQVSFKRISKPHMCKAKRVGYFCS